MQLSFLGACYHRLLPLIHLLPPRLQVKLASSGRSYFMQQFVSQPIATPYRPDPALAISMWGITFQSPLANSAGMFKNGEAYAIAAALGAGAYLGGTSTANSRLGNVKHGIHLPFISLPQAGLAINYLGLPNLGDDVLSSKKLAANKISGCPIGWSVMRSPDYSEEEGTLRLIQSLHKYQSNQQIDFIEINESCPNIQSGADSLMPRLELISQQFLRRRQRHLPVVVKLSNDINRHSLAALLEKLISLGYDGINLGNTSTAYALYAKRLAPAELKLFTYFTREFGGGVSGSLLKQRSLELCAEAAEVVQRLKPDHEFHIIRSGGVNSLDDIIESQRHGISFNQWYTGFFNAYNQFGEHVYRNFWHGASSFRELA